MNVINVIEYLMSYYPRCVTHESSDRILNLGLSLPVGGQEN